MVEINFRGKIIRGHPCIDEGHQVVVFTAGNRTYSIPLEQWEKLPKKRV